VAAENRHVAQRLQTPPDTAFQEWPARHVHRQCLGIPRYLSRAEYLVAAERQPKLGQLSIVPNGSTVGCQFIEEPGEQLVQDLRTASQQNMNMTTLGYPTSDSRVVRQLVSLDHSNGFEELGEDSRGKHSADTRPENNRSLARSCHGVTPA
jgi:hypothetical protein